MAKKKELKLPNKKTMNLYQYDYKHDPKREIAIYAVLIVVLVAVLAKVMVIDKVLENQMLEAQNVNLQTELTELQVKAAKYNETKENYYRYTSAYSEGEEQLLDRIVITSLIKDTTEGLAEITSTSISGNMVNLAVITKDLDDLKEFRMQLEGSNLVSDVFVYSAARDTGDVSSSVAFKCVVEEAE